MKIFKILLSFFILSIISGTCAHNHSQVSFTNLLAFRTKQYSSDPYKNVIVLTPPRTGSTLVYNVVRTLFEVQPNQRKHSTKKILKKHFKKENLLINSCTLYFCTCRDPYTNLESRIKTSRIPIPREAFTRDLLESKARPIASSIMREFRVIKELCQKHNVVLLKYEDFEKDLDYIFRKIESKLHFKISSEDKSLLSKHLDKASVLKFCSKLDGFSSYDRQSHFHGNHINTFKFSESELNIIQQVARPIFLKEKELLSEFGYTID